MGAAKYNPTAIAAKRGELPPKPKTMSKTKRRALLMAAVTQKTGATDLLRCIDTPYR